ncbi:hypothetical protein [Hydrogenivirga sp.]
MKVLLVVLGALVLVSCAQRGGSDQSFDIGFRGKVELKHRR